MNEEHMITKKMVVELRNQIADELTNAKEYADSYSFRPIRNMLVQIETLLLIFDDLTQDQIASAIQNSVVEMVFAMEQNIVNDKNMNELTNYFMEHTPQ